MAFPHKALAITLGRRDVLLLFCGCCFFFLLLSFSPSSPSFCVWRKDGAVVSCWRPCCEGLTSHTEAKLKRRRLATTLLICAAAGVHSPSRQSERERERTSNELIPDEGLEKTKFFPHWLLGRGGHMFVFLFVFWFECRSRPTLAFICLCGRLIGLFRFKIGHGRGEGVVMYRGMTNVSMFSSPLPSTSCPRPSFTPAEDRWPSELF